MAKEIRTGEIVALKKIRMDNEREGVWFHYLPLQARTKFYSLLALLHFRYSWQYIFSTVPHYCNTRNKNPKEAAASECHPTERDCDISRFDPELFLLFGWCLSLLSYILHFYTFPGPEKDEQGKPGGSYGILLISIPMNLIIISN